MDKLRSRKELAYRPFSWGKRGEGTIGRTYESRFGTGVATGKGGKTRLTFFVVYRRPTRGGKRVRLQGVREKGGKKEREGASENDPRPSKLESRTGEGKATAFPVCPV